MGVIFVARSAKFSKWASDVGLTKNLFKVGYTADNAKPIIENGWAGETDWTLVKQREFEGLTAVTRLARKENILPAPARRNRHFQSIARTRGKPYSSVTCAGWRDRPRCS